MFRLKLTLLYFITIVLVVAVLWVVIDQKRDSYVQQNLVPSVQAASTSFTHLTEHRLMELKEYARSLLASDLPTYVRLLEENRDAIRNVTTRLRQEFPSRKRVRPDRLLEFVDQAASAELDAMEKTLREKTAAELNADGQFARYLRNYVLTSCLAEEDPWSVCYFKMAWLPLTQLILPAQKKDFGRALPELFILVDSDMTTRLLFDKLDASVSKFQVRGNSDKSLTKALDDALFNAGTRYKDHIIENFDQVAMVVREVQTSFKPMISSYLTLNGNRIFAVVASRIEGADGKVLGTVVVGYELGRGLAWQDTAATLGIRPVLKQCMRLATQGDGEPASETLCEHEMQQQESGVTYVYRNRKGQMVQAGTSLRENTANRVTQEARELPAETTVIRDDFIAAAVPMPLDFVPENEWLRAVLTVDEEAAVEFFTTMKVMLVVVGIIAFLLGLVVVQLLARSFSRPFEEIDAGIHEIIGGNFEYSFPFDFKEELPRSMAQSLSIMKAVLLGQPLPEDQERDDSWATDLRFSSGQAVDEDTVETEEVPIEEVKASALKESATEYYRRLFREYVEARQKAGGDTASITYIKFVEKIAKTEKSLREKFGCKQVLFQVQTKDSQVVLLPIKVVD